MQADSSTGIDHNAESPASCRAGGKADGGQSPAQEGAERVDCAEALAAAHKRIAELEREVLELRLSHSQNAVTLKEREAN